MAEQWGIGLTVVGAFLALAGVAAMIWLVSREYRTDSRLSTLRAFIRPPAAPTFEIQPGRYDEFVQRHIMTLPAVRRSTPHNDVGATDADEATPPRTDGMRAGSDLRDAFLVASPGLATGGILGIDAMRSVTQLDASALDALTQMSGEQIEGLWDLRSLQHSRGDRPYQFDAYTHRGGIGEQQAARGFESLGHDVAWPEGGKTQFGPRDNPGWDLTIDGQEVNVKVVADARRAAREHFEKYPDIPVVVNSDAENIPVDAIYVDAEHRFGAEELLGENVVLVQESLTLADVGGVQSDLADAAEMPDLEGAADLVPGLGVVIAATRSASQEYKLLASGRTEGGRAAKNVTVDTAGRGGGAAAGMQAGMAIDAALLGAGFGVPTMLGGIAGAIGGGIAAKKVKAKPLKNAQASLQTRLEKLDAEVERTRLTANESMEVGLAAEDARHRSTCVAVQGAYEDLLTRTRTRLAQATLLSEHEARDMLTAAASEVDAAESDYCALADRRGLRSRLATRRTAVNDGATAWRLAAEEARNSLAGTWTSAGVLDLVLAAPGGDLLVQGKIAAFTAERQKLHAQAVAGHHQLLELVQTSRRNSLARLRGLRETTQFEAQRELEPTLQLVKQAKETTEREYERAGLR